jgi:allantoate deiminase
MRNTDIIAPAPATERANALRFGSAIQERIEALAAISDEDGKLTRLYLGPAHRRAADRVAAWMRDAGMSVRGDAVGSIIGRYEGLAPDAPALLLGSHIDTVRDAGSFDGTVGVLTAIAVVEHLHATRTRLPFAVEVVAFGDEEGVRWPGTLTGSRALAGRFAPHLLDETDRDGILRRQALAEFGCDVSRIAAEARDPARVLGYLEVHIEQGPVLEAEDRAVAVVTAINGATRGRVTVTGESGHAGTVPMALRRDALAAAAEMVLAIERRAACEADLVATVGVLDVANGVVNAVPGSVSFTLDLRSPSDPQRQAAVAALAAEIEAIGERRRVSAKLAVTYEAAAAQSDRRITDALSTAITSLGLDVRHLASGAGHDAMSFKDVIPFAMLFVRCRGGISHNPAEYATPEDIDTATRVLLQFVEHLGRKPIEGP